ncbi:cupin domain-containing protein [Halieaceae bacterium]|nr:cupin domain-containing protein [Halieaceae bacterium]
MPDTARLLLLNPDSVTAEEYFLPQEKLIEGNPRQRLWNLYTDATGKYFSGFWESDVGKWSINYTEEETCHLIAGISIVTDEEGNATELRAGDNFVIPKGFRGTWEVVEPTRKLYAIFEDAG